MEARFACDSFCVGMVCNSPCFWCCLVLNPATHYTIKFDGCQILSEIYHEETKDTKFFDRIYRMIGIWAVEGGEVNNE